MQWCDAGVNWLSKQFAGQHQQILSRAQQHHITKFLCIATDLEEAHALHDWLGQPELYATAGIHPHQASTVNEHSWSRLHTLLKHDKVVAIGECGLDFNRNFSPAEAQIYCFEQQLQIAQCIDKAVYLHERDAFNQMQNCLQTAMPKRAIIHCFTGNQTQLRWYLDQGFFIGITGWICDERRGQELAELVPYIPDDRIILETDAPYLIPRDHTVRPKPKFNEPFLIPHIAATVAKLRNTELSVLAQQVWQNSQQLLQWSHHENV